MSKKTRDWCTARVGTSVVVIDFGEPTLIGSSTLGDLIQTDEDAQLICDCFRLSLIFEKSGINREAMIRCIGPRMSLRRQEKFIPHGKIKQYDHIIYKPQ
jgi:hypothetical protein